MSRFGVPKTIVSDNGTAFCSREFELFCATNGISHMTSPVYHPPSNGQAESLVKIVKKGLKSCLMSSHSAKESSVRLLKYLMDYRNSVHTTTGLSPAQLVFGHKLRSRLDMINPKSSAPSSPSVSDYVKNQQCTQTKQQRKNKTIFFELNDIVLYKKFVNKANYTWCKGIIIKRIGKVLYLVKDFDNPGTYKRHKNQLMPYKGTRNNNEHNVQNPLLNLPGSSPLPSSSPPPSPSPPSSPPPTPPPQSAPLSATSETAVPQPELDLPNLRPGSSVKGKRPEGKEASTSSSLREDKSLSDSPQADEQEQQTVSNEADVETTERRLDSEDEFQEAETDTQESQHDSSIIVTPKRSLRNRPVICFKKYF